MRDLPASLDLLALGRELLLDELLPLLPPERHRDARLIATAMSIVAREAAAAGWQQELAASIRDFYGEAGGSEVAPHPGPLPAIPGSSPGRESEGLSPQGWQGDGRSAVLLCRLAQDLRNGAFETSPSRAAAARAILWRLTIGKLREGNPHFLAANGFDPAGGESE